MRSTTSDIVALAVLLTCLLACMLPPAHAGIAPEGRTTQVRIARPGDTYRGSIVVRNTGRTPTDIKVYTTDYAFSADGRNRYDAPGTLPRSNATWLRLNQEQLAIDGGGRSRIDYEVRVPDDGRLTGTYWSTVMIEELGGVESVDPQRGRAQLRQVIRHAIQVITEIGASGRSEITFDNAQLSVEEGKRWFAVDLENKGERWLRMDIWLELHDPQGRLAGRFPGTRQRTFPATSVRSRIDLSKVAPGRYLALLVADAGNNDLFGTRIDLEIR